jgi:hemin uptake protein HemP
MKPDLDSKPAARRITDARAKAPEITRSQELFGERRELVIEHEGFLYRLRITQNNKLILTK